MKVLVYFHRLDDLDKEEYLQSLLSWFQSFFPSGWIVGYMLLYTCSCFNSLKFKCNKKLLTALLLLTCYGKKKEKMCKQSFPLRVHNHEK